MDNKKKLLDALLGAPDGTFVSGSELANILGVSRAAVWKHIAALRAEGYDIKAVTNRGYMLGESSDVLSEKAIKKYLGEKESRVELEILPACGSTNLVIKEKANTLGEGHVVIAGEQTAGRGRYGRTFLSPGGTGLYMSVLLRPKLSAEDAVMITTAAAVAVCRAIEELTPDKPTIKWVNDVLVNGKKVCGILTEASFDMESGALDYAVLGVGINVTESDGGFPQELADIAGAILQNREHDMRCRLASSFLRHFFDIYDTFPSRSFVEEYRIRSFLPGRPILVLRQGTSVPAKAVAIDDRCRLIVRYADGSEEALSSGEVSVRPAGGAS